MNIIKIIQIFIICILIIEFFSFLLGYGTHFETYKFIVLISIMVFNIDFEIENKFLNVLMTKSFQFGLDKIADAFQKRAEELFGNSKN